MSSSIISCHQSWGNLVTCNLSYVIFITFQVKSNITKLLFSQVICNLIILLSEVILLFVYSSYVKLLPFLVKRVFYIHVHW